MDDNDSYNEIRRELLSAFVKRSGKEQQWQRSLSWLDNKYAKLKVNLSNAQSNKLSLATRRIFIVVKNIRLRLSYFLLLK